ncbi:hypothetical protein SLEP1_g59798 [Rubroshorea leprosula]|uniref:N-acetyltransferase domain-containing protein n=1 Tax=Rubroshorea leprosula TaxID=152421 RepID=A0AAV5MTD4_9ROSI|nr:hypothetical protein SLEP1_g59798 [Rubroshorea leprosula]
MEEDDKGEVESSSPSLPPILGGRGRVARGGEEKERRFEKLENPDMGLLVALFEFGGFEKNPKFGGFEELEALVDVENIGSQRVLENAGFTREGVSRKYYMLKGRTREPRSGEKEEGRRESKRIRRRKKKDE